MKKSFLVLASCLALAACTKERILEPSTSNESNAISTEKAIVARPMMVDFYARHDMTQAPVPCLPAPNIFVAGGFSIFGTATHIGLVNSANSFGKVLNCNLGPLSNELTTQNTGQIAAANGDLMYYKSTEQTNVLTGSFTGLVTVTGGTGRFANAGGSINIQGTVNFQTGFIRWTGSGTIAY